MEKVVLHCSSCGKVIGKAKPGSEVEIKCKCGTINNISVKPESQSFSNKKPEVTKSASA